MDRTAARPVGAVGPGPAPAQSAPAGLVKASAALEQLDKVIVSLLGERILADAKVQALRANAHLGARTLSEENEILERYAGPLGRLGSRIAMLLLTQ